MKSTALAFILVLSGCLGGSSYIPPRGDAGINLDSGGGCGQCPADHTCINGSCVSCGKMNQPCCGGTACTDGSTCTAGVCIMGQGCGTLGKPCCNGTTCTDGSNCSEGICTTTQSCGTLGLPCCNGTTCTDGSACQAGFCAQQQSCGTLGLPCCGGVSCIDGSTCQNGFCAQACGTLGRQCCNGVTCTDGSSCVGGVCSTPQGAVGETCTSAAQCSGSSAQCYTTIPLYNWQSPGGYCSNSNCTSDVSCGTNGFCDTSTHECFGNCGSPGECQGVNPNNRCYNFDGTHYACLPAGVSQCDPTAFGTCNGTNACSRVGLDNVGLCLMTCSFGGACPNNAQGQAQNCLYFNEMLDGSGNPTQDKFSGLACFGVSPTPTPANSACTYIDECVTGYECDFFMTGGSKVCRQLCKVGTTTCPAGTCNNAFQLPTFANGSIGLCY